MPTKGRRGRYAKRHELMARHLPELATEWSEQDYLLYNELLRTTPLLSQAAKEGLCKRAVELDRACRSLDARVRNSNEERAMVAASTQYRKTLECLRLADKISDEDQDL